jgi:tRNA dimethylallyltransferase
MKYIIVCGPTCTGKTRLGVQLALRYRGEIINADSRQIYKHTTIGTAKPTIEEMQGAPHHLFDFLELDQDFSAYQYADMALAVMRDIDGKSKLPIIVGGTGLYLKALTEGIFKSPKPDNAYREELNRIAKAEGAPKLHAMLTEVDSVAAAKIKPRDTVRLIRALEIHKQTGRTIGQLQKAGEYITPPGNPLWIGLTFVRKELYQRINKRVDNMIDRGLEQETLSLEPFIAFVRKRKMIGYSDLIECLFDKTITRDEAIAQVKQHHRNYAKRQLTWFNRNEKINWFNPGDGDYPESVFRISDKYRENA